MLLKGLQRSQTTSQSVSTMNILHLTLLSLGGKPDLRNLLRLFSVAHIRSYSNPDSTSLQNTDSHSTSAIFLCRSKHSPSTLFYHPTTGRTIISDDYYLDEALPAGPALNLSYQGKFHFRAYIQLNDSLKFPTLIPKQLVFVNIDGSFQQAKVLSLPEKGNDIYTLQILNDNSIHQYMEKEIFSNNPSVEIHHSGSDYIYFPKWISNGANATFFPPNAIQPQHGKLFLQDDKWYFRPGRSEKNPSVYLPDFHHKAFTFQQNLILFKGHESFKKIHAIR